MNYLDRDLNKLYKYINQLGLKFFKKKYNKYTGEAEYVSGESITLFTRSETSKTSMILSLLHELGHHLDWLDKKDTKAEIAAMIALNDGKMIGNRPDLTKKGRGVILEIEKAGVKHMSTIHKLLNLEIPYYKVKYQQDFDLFQYKYLYKYGKFATLKDMKKAPFKLKTYKKNMENKVFTPITVEEATKYLQEKKVEILEQFAKAYLAETELKPSEVELVTQQMPVIDNKIETVYYFRKKT